MTQQHLRIVPLDLATANRAVERWHRHHAPTVGHRWSIGCEDESGQLVGVAIAGRPVARMLDDGRSVEVTRLATDGTPNACSCLYGAMKRIAAAMGYQRIITYTLTTESGASLRGAGWTEVQRETRARNWNMPGRPRLVAVHTDTPKVRWECSLVPESRRRPRVKPIFGALDGPLLEAICAP